MSDQHTPGPRTTDAGLPVEHLVVEAIVLAGGLGTRLREAVPDLPKCMAPVAGKPFLSHVINSLRMQGIERFIFSLGYKWGVIEEWLRKNYPTLQYRSVIEDEPLGTGGAIRLAIEKATSRNVLIANGDTLFRISMDQLLGTHLSHNAECTMSLKPMKDFDRYGVVEINGEETVISFLEKKFYEQGLINGGVYLLDKEQFLRRIFPEKFSFEKDYLEQYYQEGTFAGSIQEGYFIDIGIPSDYQKAQQDLAPRMLDLSAIDKGWTLFLDRDGVINEERVNSYVHHWEEFIFNNGVLDVFKKLSDHFGRIIVVSNQRGVGKGLMTVEALDSIHLEMQREVEIVHGKIDRIYYCTEKDEQCFDRKPNPGMAVRAVRDFPSIDLNRSIMVGNKPSDMKFGRAAGMFTVFVKTTNPDQPFPHPDIDRIYDNLKAFAEDLEEG